MTSRAVRALVVLTCVGGIPGCALLVKPKPPELPLAHCGGVTLDNPSRAMALVSVQFNSDPPLAAIAPIQIMPIDKAVLLIRCDEGDAAELRRRRTVAKLATAHDPLVQDHVRQLVGHADEVAIKGIVASLAVAPKLVKETAVYNYIFNKYGAVSRCSPTYPVTTVTRGKDDTVHASTSFDVNRSVAALKVVWDPQQWQQCSAFFTHSYVPDSNVSLPSNCASSDPAPTSAPPARGSIWSRKLYEQFTFSWTSSWFKNLLDISTYTANFGSGSLYAYRYALGRSVCSQVLGGTQDRGVEVDDGYSYLWAGPSGWTSTITAKNVRFSGRPASGSFGLPIPQQTMNDYAEVLMNAMGAETSTMACCKPKPSPLSSGQ